MMVLNWGDNAKVKSYPVSCPRKRPGCIFAPKDDPAVRKRRLGDLGGLVPAKQERMPVSFARLVRGKSRAGPPILKLHL
jgi:hypothetical protein